MLSQSLTYVLSKFVWVLLPPYFYLQLLCTWFLKTVPLFLSSIYNYFIRTILCHLTTLGVTCLHYTIFFMKFNHFTQKKIKFQLSYDWYHSTEETDLLQFSYFWDQYRSYNHWNWHVYFWYPTIFCTLYPVIL